MTDQPTLFDPPYQRSSSESREGADAIVPHLEELERRVLDAYRYAQEIGMTDEEAARFTRIKVTTVIPRRHTLMRRGLVAKIGRRRAPSGVTVGVYGLAKFARGAKK